MKAFFGPNSSNLYRNAMRVKVAQIRVGCTYEDKMAAKSDFTAKAEVAMRMI